MSANKPSAVGRLFVKLQGLTTSREDLLTYCLAAVLEEDQILARGFVSVLACGKRLGGVNIGSATIGIETQCHFRGQGARVDMVIRVGPCITIGVEHKLLAPEGRDQVERYLAIPKAMLTYIAVITGRKTKLGIDAANSARVRSRLLRPSATRNHFLWSEFYDLIANQRSTRRPLSPLRRAFVELLNANYLQAAHPLIGYVKHGDADEVERADARLFDLWRSTIRALERPKHGFDIFESMNSRSELYASAGDSRRPSPLCEVRLDPRHSPGALRISLKSHSRAASDRVLTQLRRAKAIPHQRHIELRQHLLKKGQVSGSWSVDVMIPWVALLGRCSTRKSVEPTLKRFVVALVEATS